MPRTSKGFEYRTSCPPIHPRPPTKDSQTGHRFGEFETCKFREIMRIYKKRPRPRTREDLERGGNRETAADSLLTRPLENSWRDVSDSPIRHFGQSGVVRGFLIRYLRSRLVFGLSRISALIHVPGTPSDRVRERRGLPAAAIELWPVLMHRLQLRVHPP
ncbi:hypothetical protein KM043_010934 [Ampulex compressa]|nr:hypothetical protein KM043_010934 [Ampulex compressa]